MTYELAFELVRTGGRGPGGESPDGRQHDASVIRPESWAAIAGSELAVVELDRAHVVRGWSVGAARVFGVDAYDALDRPLAALGLLGDPVRARQFDAITAGVLAGKAWSGERTLHRPDGNAVAVRATIEPIRGLDGTVLGMVLLALDVSGREAYERALVREAMRDPLTGLPNRALLFDRLERLVQGEELGAGTMAVVFVDLDGFKAVNDAYGHAVGDIVLRTVASRLRGAVRDADMVGRLGGDEFVVLCAIPAGRDTSVVRDRILRAIEAPIVVGDRTLSIRASIGVARVEQGAGADVVLDLADADMYRAKGARGSSRRE